MVVGAVECDESVSTPLREPVPSRVVLENCAPDRALAGFVAKLFAILHPAVLPMLDACLKMSDRMLRTTANWG
jgi:hypothetical protein